jgi:hypothetical protein
MNNVKFYDRFLIILSYLFFIIIIAATTVEGYPLVCTYLISFVSYSQRESNFVVNID